MLRPKLPAPVVYTPTPAAPVVHVPAAAPACSCQHHTPAPGPAYGAPLVVQGPAANRPPLGLYLAGGTVAVAGVVALAVAVTALFLAIAVTAISVTVAAVVLRGLLADTTRGQR